MAEGTPALSSRGGLAQVMVEDRKPSPPVNGPGAGAGETDKLSRLALSFGLIAITALLVSFLWLVIARPGASIGTTLLVLLFAFGAIVVVPTLGPQVRQWKLTRSLALGVSFSFVLTSLLLGLLQILPDKHPESSSLSPTASETPSPSPTPTPTPLGKLVVTAEESATIKAQTSFRVPKYGLRITLGFVEDGFADVGIHTNAGGCIIAEPDFLDVGESIVLTDRPKGGDRYENWYRVDLDRTDKKKQQILVTWSVGTGTAPRGADHTCGVNE
jgi:hypothetical protein